jgi:hypothetical protein
VPCLRSGLIQLRLQQAIEAAASRLCALTCRPAWRVAFTKQRADVLKLGAESMCAAADNGLGSGVHSCRSGAARCGHAAAAKMGVCLTADSEDAHTSCRICFEEAPVEDLISPCKCKVRSSSGVRGTRCCVPASVGGCPRHSSSWAGVHWRCPRHAAPDQRSTGQFATARSCRRSWQASRHK